MSLYSNPNNLNKAYSLLAAGNWKILSGGTDFYPSLGQTKPSFDVLDISKIASIRDIKTDVEGNWHIGALSTWSDVIRHDLPASFDGLKLSAREVGSVQIQNRATVVGNICNASPAADGVPPLLALGAIVKIGSKEGEREISLDQFILGNRQINLQPHEMVVGLKIPSANAVGKSSFLKLGTRKYLVISISMVAARLSVNDENLIESAAISVGSCSVVAARLDELEAVLIGKKLSGELISYVDDKHFDVLSPIDDVRASRGYRMDACKELVKRAITTIVKDY